MDEWRKHPIKSTYISDPNAKFRVISSSRKYGSGIQGFYTCEFHAQRMARFLKDRGDSDVEIEHHNPNENVVNGIHPLVEKALQR